MIENIKKYNQDFKGNRRPYFQEHFINMKKHKEDKMAL